MMSDSAIEKIGRLAEEVENVPVDELKTYWVRREAVSRIAGVGSKNVADLMAVWRIWMIINGKEPNV